MLGSRHEEERRRRATVAAECCGRGQPAQGQIHIVFTDDITERELRTLLGRVQGKIVDGPSTIGAYTLEVGPSTADDLTRIVAILRADPKVQLAEPVLRR